jgi:hypothetical protein
MTEAQNLSDVQAALARKWGGEVRLSGPHPFDRNGLDENVVRLHVEQAPAGTPNQVLVKRAGPGYHPNRQEERPGPAHHFFNEWASLAFFQEVCGEATPVPRLYAVDREAGFFVMEDLPGPDPVMAAFWGDDPQQLADMLKRYAILLGELSGRAAPHTQRLLELRQGFGPIWPGHTPIGVLQQYLQILEALGFGLPSDAQADVAEIGELLSPPTPFLTVLHGDPHPGQVAETAGRLRFFCHPVTGLIHARAGGGVGRLVHHCRR